MGSFNSSATRVLWDKKVLKKLNGTEIIIFFEIPIQLLTLPTRRILNILRFNDMVKLNYKTYLCLENGAIFYHL